MKGRFPTVVLLFGIVALVASPALAASRRLAIVVDTSGSMQQNDPRRYTMQLAQVIADLADTSDELSVIRMSPGFGFFECANGPDPSLVLRLDPAKRADFKRQLDAHLLFNTGTFFAAPIRTAISILSLDHESERMLLVIADAGGLGSCETALTAEMRDLKQEGVTIAAINLGGGGGAFDRNPAFDFTTSALDSQGLIEAVALVYQRFLGVKRVQTGRVQGEVSVEIAPYVQAAVLVVAADGPIDTVDQAPGNPHAASIDLNHRGGGQTLGLDGVLRGYRIVRLTRPAPGRWRFRARALDDRAGWMLLQDSAVGVRLVSSPTMAKGIAVPLEVELFDQRTGETIKDPSQLSGLRIEAEVDGRKFALRDAGNGVYSATTTFDRSGDRKVNIHLQSDLLDRKASLAAKVVDAAWKLTVTTPKKAEVDQAVPLSVAVTPIGAAQTLAPLERVDVKADASSIELRDDGRGDDREAGDRTLTGSWTPSHTGTVQLEYVPPAGSAATRVRSPIEVVGRLKFGAPNPIRFGRLASKSEGWARLDLSNADARGNFDLQIATPFHGGRRTLEIDLGGGWVPIGLEPVTLRLGDHGRRVWPLRLRVGECPEGQPAGKPFEIVITGTRPDGQPVRTAIPVSVEIVPDSWLHCWWPALALGGAALLLGVLIHGYWWPSRFGARLGVMLSPEEDIAEGFLHPIRAQRGSRSGFYRDARLYVCEDYRLAAKPHSAVARLRADRKLVRIEPSAGAAVWRRNAEGTWEQIPSDESTMRFGDLYRNDAANLFFQLRNA
jgi:hypothetical protein